MVIVSNINTLTTKTQDSRIFGIMDNISKPAELIRDYLPLEDSNGTFLNSNGTHSAIIYYLHKHLTSQKFYEEAERLLTYSNYSQNYKKIK